MNKKLKARFIRKNYFTFLGLFIAVLLFSRISADAKVVFSQSPVKIASFLNCESPICVPMPYRWQGSVRIEYDSYYDPSIGTNRVLIKKVEQSVTMFGVGFNPCGIDLGASTKGYDKWGNYYWTIYSTYPGSFIWSPTSLFWGRVAYPNWWIPGPKLRTTAVANASDCFGFASISWDTYLP
jgi:hypothetical protein